MSSRRVVLALVLLFGSTSVRAQQGPLGDADGGASGPGAPPEGAGSVPLVWPPERDGLPIPLAVVGGGGNQVGAAGPGWDVPLSMVSWNQTFSRNRPLNLAIPGPPLINPDRGPVVTLAGVATPFLRVSGDVFRARVGQQAMELRQVGDAWELFDGNGLRYRFERLPGLATPWPWFLVEIAGQRHAHSVVRLVYAVGAGPEVLLTGVLWNFDRTGTCAKHTVVLAYDTPLPPPEIGSSGEPVALGGQFLGVAILDGQLLVRNRFLSGIEVSARGNDCGSAPALVGRYRFRYAPDADTGARRLVAVDTAGRPGMPFGDIWRPVARWVYGRATATSAGYAQVTFAERPSLPIPSTLGEVAVATGGGVTTTVTLQELLDRDGDGLVDLVGRNQWQRNLGGLGFAAPALLAPSPTFVGELGAVRAKERPRSYRPKPTAELEDRTAQSLDWNGDGRPDRVLVGTAPGTWTLVLDESTGWRTVVLPMADVGDAMRALGHDFESSSLPVGRTVTGYSYTDRGCRVWSGGAWIPCPAYPTTVTDTGPETTITEWRLADINGDGYPDLVAHTRPTRVVTDLATHCRCDDADLTACPRVNWEDAVDPRRVCSVDTRRFTLPVDNELVVFYNRAGVALDGSSPFAAPLVLDNSRGSLGRFYASSSTRYSYTDPGDSGRLIHGFRPGQTSEQDGLLDVTGDGIPDLVGAKTLAGTGTGFVDAGLAAYPRVVHATTSDYWEQCHEGASWWPTVSQTVIGYLDINGDGILDYVADDTVRFGTGIGLGARIPVASPEPLILSETESTCGLSQPTKVRAGTWDLDGDGRPELVRLGDRPHALSLFEPDAGWGAPASAQVVAIENGYGAVTHQRFASQKDDLTTAHQVPFPEIRLVERWTERKNGTLAEQLVATRLAYGGAHLWFDHAADRWVFPGYERQVAVTGSPASAKDLEGQALIADSVRPADLAPGVRNVLVGQPRRSSRLAGSVPRDPRNLLLVEPHDHSGWRGETTFVADARTIPLPGFANNDCALAGQPQGGLGAALERPCRLAAIPYVKQVNRRDGEGALWLTRFTETEREIVEIDDLGRALVIRHAGDLFKPDDDLCEVRRYAAPVTTAWPVHGALAARWLREPDPGEKRSTCGKGANLAGERFRYDHLAEGVVGVGRLSDEIVERRDGAGELLDQWTTATSWVDADGNLVRIDQENGQGAPTQVELAEWDAFGLHSGRRTTLAPDVPGTFVERTDVDPYTLAPTRRTGVDGEITRLEYDGLSRPTQATWIDPQDHIEYLAARVDYQGDTVVVPVGPPNASTPPISDAFDPLGRRALVRTWSEALPLAQAPTAVVSPTRAEQWTYRTLDFLGRLRREEMLLGDDYAGARLVTHDVEYDTLGRVAFSADPHTTTSATLASFGTSYTYDPDGSVRCAIRARGFQISEQTSTADNRFVSCTSTHFLHGTRVVSTRGPVENDPSSDIAGAESVSVLDGNGRIIRRSRIAASAVLEQMDLVADRLGRPTLLLRRTDPAAALGPLWITSHDSLGQVVLYDEPGSAQRNAVYDRAGHLVETWWLDGPVRHSVGTRYDGLGRTVASSEVTAGFEDPESVVSYLYDAPSGDGFDPPAGPSRGRLTHAHGATQSVYLGYDGRGRVAFTTWVDQGERVERELRYRADGQPAQVRLRLPDTGYHDEIAAYAYDSAQRLQSITWQDENFPSPTKLYKVNSIDAAGRPRAVGFGNGVKVGLEYRDEYRDELLTTELWAANGSLYTKLSYDAALRLSERAEGSTVDHGREEIANFHYDGAGRLDHAQIRDGVSGTPRWDDRFKYDGLGNRTALTDGVGDRDQVASFDTLDADRLCAVSGAGFPKAKECQFRYDVPGNVVEAPHSVDSWLALTYDNRSRVRRAKLQPTGVAAEWSYGPFGDVASLTITGGLAPRYDLRYGDAAARLVLDGEKVYERQIPGPDGVIATKRGSFKDARFLYWHRDGNGTRAFSDDDGAIVQEVVYGPFGESRGDSGAPGTFDYTTFQWNEGDALADLGVTQLGPRLFDARLGRFLQRDPLVLPDSAAKANPYAFAWNDPVNFGDPSGLCTEGNPDSCSSDPLTTLVGFLGSGLGRQLGDWLGHGVAGSAGSGPKIQMPSTADVMRQLNGVMASTLQIDLVPARYWQFNMRIHDQGLLDGGGPGALCGATDGAMRMACQANRAVTGRAPYDGPDYSVPRIAAIQQGGRFWSAVASNFAIASVELTNPMVWASRGITEDAAPLRGLVEEPSDGLGAMRRPEYEASAKHHPGRVQGDFEGPAPKNGQEALNTAVTTSDTGRTRVGIDYENGDFVVFSFQENRWVDRQGVIPIYHGHVRTWKQLDNDMRSALTKWGMANKRGRIIH